MPLAELVRTQRDDHLPVLRRQMPAILGQLRTVAAGAGGERPELRMVHEVFRSLAAALQPHLEREEYLVFPHILELADAVAEGRRAVQGPFATLSHPVRMMEDEHQAALAGLGRLHDLTRGYTPPALSVPGLAECFAALADFDARLREHIRVTDHELFPGALELEERLHMG